jgi:hypothetical protein
MVLVTIELVGDSSISTISNLAMNTRREATNIFRGDFACGDPQAAEELLIEEGMKLIDRQEESIRKSIDSIIYNDIAHV